MEAAMSKRPREESQSWQDWCDAFRKEYNEVRPHEALNMDVPAQHWKPSERGYRRDPPAWEYAEPERVRRVGANGGIRMGGRSYFISRAFIGELVEVLVCRKSVRQWDERAVVLTCRKPVYYCQTPLQELDLKTGTSHALDYGQLARLRIQGIPGAGQARGLCPCDPRI
jgi:hypothetical protein